MRTRLTVREQEDSDGVCPLCREWLGDAPTIACTVCGAEQHRDCVDELGGCHPTPRGEEELRAEPRAPAAPARAEAAPVRGSPPAGFESTFLILACVLALPVLVGLLVLGNRNESQRSAPRDSREELAEIMRHSEERMQQLRLELHESFLEQLRKVHAEAEARGAEVLRGVSLVCTPVPEQQGPQLEPNAEALATVEFGADGEVTRAVLADGELRLGSNQIGHLFHAIGLGRGEFGFQVEGASAGRGLEIEGTFTRVGPTDALGTLRLFRRDAYGTRTLQQEWSVAAKTEPLSGQ